MRKKSLNLVTVETTPAFLIESHISILKFSEITSLRSFHRVADPYASSYWRKEIFAEWSFFEWEILRQPRFFVYCICWSCLYAVNYAASGSRASLLQYQRLLASCNQQGQDLGGLGSSA